MTETKLIRDFWAEPSPNRNGWIGRYQAPGVGVCTVKVDGLVLRETGKPVAAVFETKIEAEMAAARAKDRAEDRHRRPHGRAARVFQAVGTGRNRRAIAI